MWFTCTIALINIITKRNARVSEIPGSTTHTLCCWAELTDRLVCGFAKFSTTTDVSNLPCLPFAQTVRSQQPSCPTQISEPTHQGKNDPDLGKRWLRCQRARQIVCFVNMFTVIVFDHRTGLSDHHTRLTWWLDKQNRGSHHCTDWLRLANYKHD